jgi:hypothetical protein
MAQSGKADQTMAHMSSKLDEVLGHVQVIPALQSDIKLFKMDVAVLQLDMAAANATLRQHNTVLGDHTVSITELQGDVAALKLHVGY